jgi:LAO/AO transport system kinase
MTSPELEKLAVLVRSGDPRALARALSSVENDSPGSSGLLHHLYNPSRLWKTIGITGPPGAGKSTLANRLIAHWREAGRKIGVLAVDPSSPFSGGAILGDRLRMQDHACDPGVFIRSMGSRGHVGGLSGATAAAAEVLGAAGYDPVVVETVGVGQGEVEVAGLADITLLILVPGLGDDVQVMKAGIMEIGDVIVLNKADRPGIDQLEVAVRASIDLLPSDAPRPAVIKCSAETGEGLDSLFSEVDGRLGTAAGSEEARRERAREDILRVVEGRGVDIGRRLLERVYGREKAIDMVLAGETSPWKIGEELAELASKALE